ncbi:MAG TPA: hypothetical protein VI793_18110 [Anaerolineales bacterium]|nr:hypothetical protein [Anaerolineales bacterium]
MDIPRRISPQPDPILARVERIFFPNGLTLEDRVRMAVRAAKLEMEPKWIEILRQLPPGIKIYQAFCLWNMARDALYMQGIRRGLSPEEAMQEAARRLIATKNVV